MPFRVTLGKGQMLFWKRSDAEQFAGSAGAAAGGVVSEVQILGSPWIPEIDPLRQEVDRLTRENQHLREISGGGFW